SMPISRLKPAISAARIAASLRGAFMAPPARLETMGQLITGTAWWDAARHGRPSTPLPTPALRAVPPIMDARPGVTRSRAFPNLSGAASCSFLPRLYQALACRDQLTGPLRAHCLDQRACGVADLSLNCFINVQSIVTR